METISWPDLPKWETQCCLTPLKKLEKLLAPMRRVMLVLGRLDASVCCERNEVMLSRLLGVN